MTFDSLAASVVSGLLQGALYGAIGAGLTLIFGVMRVVNFAHGSLLMLGMFASFYGSRMLGADPYVGIVVAVPTLFVVGYAIQRVLITPLYKRERAFVIEPTSVLILTAGLWLVLDNIALIVFGTAYRRAPSALSAIILQFGELGIPLPRLIAAGGSLALTGLLFVLLNRTGLGRSMRATAQNRDAAALAGIDVYRVYALTFGIGAAMTAAAGALLLPFFYVHPGVGFAFDIRAFLIVVLGGLGSVSGTLLAGLIMGLVEAVAVQFVPGTYAQLLFFVLFIAVLVARPRGLFGRGD